MNLTIYTDGGARGNPGPAAIGVVLQDTDTSQPIHEAGYFIGRATNNVAEYSALIRALELALQYKAVNVSLHSDSELMVKQIIGKYKVKSRDLAVLHEQARKLLRQFDTWKIKHVYREMNGRADELANLAQDAKGDVVVVASNTDSPTSAKRQPATQASALAPDSQGEQYPMWTATVTSSPEGNFPGGCELGQVFTFGPYTPEGMCVFAAQAMFARSPTTLLNGKGPRVNIRCPRCGSKLRVEMQV